MIEVGKLYKPDSNPLEEVNEKEIGEIYHTVEGHRIKYLGEDEFTFLQRSPLISTELITGLNERMLNTFWSLRRNDIFYSGE